jgi:hypothetical protein
MTLNAHQRIDRLRKRLTDQGHDVETEGMIGQGEVSFGLGSVGA